MNANDLWLIAAGFLAAWLRASAPIILAALGGFISEMAGVINVGLEGVMLSAAFFGVVGSALVTIHFPDAPAWCPATIGAVSGLAAAIGMSLLLGVFHLELKADLIVAGIGVNLLASALTVFLMVTFTGDKGSTASLASSVLPDLHIPGFAAWPRVDGFINGPSSFGVDAGSPGHHIMIWAALLATLTLTGVLARTRLGLRWRAVGENRDAALAAGLPVKRLQYAALAACGLLAGMGGLYLSMGYLTMFQTDMTAGRGFLALAAIFLGGRKPLGTLAASMLFGASSVLAARLGTFDLPSQVVYMLPPIITLVAVIAFSNRQRNRTPA